MMFCDNELDSLVSYLTNRETISPDDMDSALEERYGINAEQLEYLLLDLLPIVKDGRENGIRYKGFGIRGEWFIRRAW